MKHLLLERLPPADAAGNDVLLDQFLSYVTAKKLELYSAQEEAILELFEGKNVILNTPTGSGKSLVALALHFHSMAQGRRSVYTSPVKALVNEKFLALCHDFGPENVGLVTGDATVNRDAKIICCTAEILSNLALQKGAATEFQDIVVDEFHYYSDRSRGVAWQIPLLTLKNSRFLLMSATLADMDAFLTGLTQLNGRASVLVQSSERPVPLHFEYKETPLHETIQELIGQNRAPIYVVSFTQRECADTAQSLMSTDFCTKEQKRAILDELQNVSFPSPYGKEFSRLIKHGVGLHHGGLMPRYRILVERLAQKGLLKIICGTDTLGVGVNIPIRSVLLTQLCKYDGEKTALLSVRDFHQISGRAGRKGFDVEGKVVAQAPEHVIENLRMEQKAAGDPKKLRKLVKRQPPQRGYVPWSRDTFDRMIKGKPEPLISRFQVTHGMLLHVLSRKDGGGCEAMQALIHDSHEKSLHKKQHRKAAFQLFRSLLDRKIIEWEEFAPTTHDFELNSSRSVATPLLSALDSTASETRKGRRVRVNVDLQTEFSLNQSLSLYLIDTLAHLDPYAEEYPADVLTMVESILESPDVILRKQLDRVKGERLRELKEAGVEYDERMAELELLEHPKPKREFIYETFNAFVDKHPWIGNENIRPKSIAREMWETFQSFDEYIREYDLQRAEGILLRYLTDVYKALVQTVPGHFKNEQIDAITDHFGSMVRRVDSSLLDEWEKMKNPLAWETHHQRDENRAKAEAARAQAKLDSRTLTIQLRNEVFRFVRALASGEWETAIQMADGGPDREDQPWTQERFEALAKAYSEEHSGILTTPQARATEHTTIDRSGENEGTWRLTQILVDPEGLNDWTAEFEVLLERSRQEQKPVFRILAIGP